MNLKQVYDVTISLLTPLHIGSGAELRRDYDYVTHNNRTWVMNADAFLEAIYWRDGNLDERIIGRPASELLQPQDFRPDSDYFRYVLPGTPRAAGHGAVLREQYKNAQDLPYIPGSSLKGALRTALAWHGFQDGQMHLDVAELRGSRSWAGQTLEREIFGRNPNYDLLRALQVADSQPQPVDRLQIVNAQVVTQGDQFGSPIELEAVRSDTTFQTTIVIDNALHSPLAEQQLKFGEKWNWLTDLPAIVRAYTLERVQAEQAWFQPKYPQIAGFYRQLGNALKGGGVSGQSFLLHIGWGGGWQGKTIGKPLQQDTNEWERLLNDKRLSPARFQRRRGDIFPKSRRAVVAQNKAVAPLGWCLVEMKER